VDDTSVQVTTPFPIRLYSTTTSTPRIQSNGCICLGGCSGAYSNTALPTTSFAGATAMGFWDDLYIYSGTSQTVYYGTTGTYPNRALVFEFYTAHYTSSTRYYRFQIVFYENNLGVVRYYYFQASDGGVSATIGVQSSSSGPVIRYSYNQNVVPIGSTTQGIPTLTLEFNTNTGTVTSSG